MLAWLFGVAAALVHCGDCRAWPRSLVMSSIQRGSPPTYEGLICQPYGARSLGVVRQGTRIDLQGGLYKNLNACTIAAEIFTVVFTAARPVHGHYDTHRQCRVPMICGNTK